MVLQDCHWVSSDCCSRWCSRFDISSWTADICTRETGHEQWQMCHFFCFLQRRWSSESGDVMVMVMAKPMMMPFALKLLCTHWCQSSPVQWPVLRVAFQMERLMTAIIAFIFWKKTVTLELLSCFFPYFLFLIALHLKGQGEETGENGSAGWMKANNCRASFFSKSSLLSTLSSVCVSVFPVWVDSFCWHCWTFPHFVCARRIFTNRSVSRLVDSYDWLTDCLHLHQSISFFHFHFHFQFFFASIGCD